MIVPTKLWVDVQEGEDEGEYLIFFFSEEKNETDKVVEQEWSQHRCSHLGVRGETTDSLIISSIGTEADWILLTLFIIIMTIFTIVSSPVQFDDQINVSPNVEGWESDVEDEEDQDCLHLHLLSVLSDKFPAVFKLLLSYFTCHAAYQFVTTCIVHAQTKMKTMTMTSTMTN